MPDDGEAQSPVPVHPQLRPKSDGRGAAARPRWGRFEVMSAGTEATHLRSLAIRVMDELGIDISGQESKTLGRYLGEPFDYVVTVCDEANEACPFFPGAKNRLHWSFEDPSQAEGSKDERLAVFRRVRDEIRERIELELVNKK
jgi:arsenate reductase (thioredoxin)